MAAIATATEPQAAAWIVDPDTCSIHPVETTPPGGRAHLTRRGAALMAYHLACEKANHWMLVKNAAWLEYVKERDAVQP